MNKYLIFRTDRIGDFLVSAILIRCIKLNDPSSHITLIASKKNYEYIKKFSFVNEAIKLENNLLDKIKLYLKLKKKIFKFIVIHDNKNRSKLISFFLKSNHKISFNDPEKYNHIDTIKLILKKMNFKFFDQSLNIFENGSNINNEEKHIQIHFDEKWIFNDYIKNYINIEPTKEQLVNFINRIIKKTKKNLVITSGNKLPVILKEIMPIQNKLKIKIYDELNFSDLENITRKSEILISCHGAISHVAAACKIKQIDIIDKSYNYSRWTHHFRNYNHVYRDKV